MILRLCLNEMVLQSSDRELSLRQRQPDGPGRILVNRCAAANLLNMDPPIRPDHLHHDPPLDPAPRFPHQANRSTPTFWTVSNRTGYSHHVWQGRSQEWRFVVVPRSRDKRRDYIAIPVAEGDDLIAFDLLVSGVNLSQSQDFANVMAGVEPALLEAVVIGVGIRRQCQEVHHQALFSGTAALGKQTLGVIGILDVLVTTILARA